MKSLNPEFVCPRRANGMHRWRVAVTGENDFVCVWCGSRGTKVSGSVVQPGQARRTRISRRMRGIPRSRTIAIKYLTQKKMRAAELETPPIPEGVTRPLKRGECAGGSRPCPWVSCRHHLYLDVNPVTGSIKFNYPHLEPHQLEVSCSLDVADDGTHTLDQVGLLLNVTRERARQLEEVAIRGPQLSKLKKDAA